MLNRDLVDWEGARNLADLGGLLLHDGQRTRPGVVFRSAATEWLTTQGWLAARRAGLSRVIDLRNPSERVRGAAHPAIDESAKAEIDVVHTPTEDPEDPVFLSTCGPWLDHPRSWTDNMRLFPGKFQQVFEAIADAPGPVLIHCAGGRDRTGMVCSMLLALAGADTSAICANYEDGFRGAALHRGHGLGYDPQIGQWIPGPDRAWTAEELDEALADRLPALREWVASTDVRRYLAEACVSPDRLDHLGLMLRP